MTPYLCGAFWVVLYGVGAGATYWVGTEVFDWDSDEPGLFVASIVWPVALPGFCMFWFLDGCKTRSEDKKKKRAKASADAEAKRKAEDEALRAEGLGSVADAKVTP